MRRAARSPWEVFAVRCLMGSSGLFVAAWLRIVVVSEDIPWVHLDVLYDFYGFFICMHTHILINRFSGLERGMSPDLWQDVSDAFSKSCVEWNGWSWLVMIGHPSESETRSQGAELDLLAWLCQELSGCKLWAFSTGGMIPTGLRSVTTARLKKTRGCQAALQHDLPPQQSRQMEKREI